MNKKYQLVIQGENSFSLSNETDSDIYTDYFPGIWGIKTQKNALKYSKQELAEGNEVTVNCYNNAKHFKLANEFIKELGLKQELFKEVADLEKGVVTNGKPSTLGALKSYLKVGTKVHIKNYNSEGQVIKERDTEVTSSNTTSITTYKIGEEGKSWIYWDKANTWSFTNEGATHNYQNSDGKWEKSFTIEYLN